MRPHARARRAGFTLLELMISATVFLLVAGAVTTSVVVSSALNTTARETAQATRAAESLLEELKGTEFAEVFARFDASTANDPALGSSPGAGFAVSGLGVQDGDADGLVGRVEFPVIGAELREDVADAELGLPRDLNGDGVVDALDHAADYRILPVRVVVAWSGKNGARTVELVTVLTDL
ncbi:MAG TPA: type II secretion system protein [Planctomycetota bacterium]